ncbi:MAG: hypothetical protein ACI4D1_06000 [Lachnospira sp.]
MKRHEDTRQRLGIYGRGIERIKLKKAVNIIEKSCDGIIDVLDVGHEKGYAEKGKCSVSEGVNAVCDAFAQGLIDMAVVDMPSLVEMSKADAELPYGVCISGILKRNDPRFVMVRKKKTRDLVKNAKVVTDTERNHRRISRLYDGVECVVEPDFGKCFDMLENDKCDAVFVLMDDVKASRKNKNFGYRYNVMDCGDCVPAHGEGVYAVLTNGVETCVQYAREVSHEETAVCFEIEEDVIRRILMNEFVTDCDVYAQIKGDRLEVYAEVIHVRGALKVCEKDELKNRNLIVRKIVDRINKSM